MADNVDLNQQSGPTGDTIAADEISGVKHQRVKVQYGADGSATDVSATNPMPCSVLSNVDNLDAFGRLRVSDPVTLFDSKQIFDNQPLLWDDQEVSGSGTSSSYSADAARSRLAVSATTAGKRVRQTFMRFNYQAGKSHLILMTGRMATPEAGLSGAMGYFDDDNGLFFKQDGTTLKVVRRTSTSGSVVDNEVARPDWNGDKLDGTGASGYTLDVTKTQIGWIDIEWLGVGRVRMGFVIDGKFIQVHEFLNTNTLDVVYMSTPNLPLRYELENDGTAGAANLDAICGTVISEGGSKDNTGLLRSINMANTFSNCNTAGTYYALLGIRLKSAQVGATVVPTTLSLQAATNDDFLWELRFNPTVAGTFTYGDITNSSLQSATGDVSNNPSTNTVTGGTVLQSGYANSETGAQANIDSRYKLGAAIDGTVDELVLCVTPMGSNADIRASLTWRELQ